MVKRRWMAESEVRYLAKVGRGRSGGEIEREAADPRIIR